MCIHKYGDIYLERHLLIFRLPRHIGGGNIGEPGKEPGLRTDKDVVPAVATRHSEEEPFHTGRGGAANVHLTDDDEANKKKKVADSSLPAAKQQTSTADKLKHKIFGMFKK